MVVSVFTRVTLHASPGRSPAEGRPPLRAPRGPARRRTEARPRPSSGADVTERDERRRLAAGTQCGPLL
jgi:hypothetical protein